MTTPNIFLSLDYRAWLRDWFTAKKAANARFSHRVFARRAGQKSPSLLLHVMEGKRNLTPATQESFAKALGLNEEEAAFFGLLVQLAQADAPDERARAMEQVCATRRFREARKLAGDAYEYLSHWYFPAVRELATLQDFRADPQWIADTLRPRIRPDEAQAALDALVRLGLLRPLEGGGLGPADASVATPHEVWALAVYNYHHAMIERAREALSTTPGSERHYCALTVSLTAESLPRLKRELDAIQERLLELCDGAPGPRVQVYQLNLNLFPLSHRRSEIP